MKLPDEFWSGTPEEILDGLCLLIDLLRERKRYTEADAIRDAMRSVGIEVRNARST